MKKYQRYIAIALGLGISYVLFNDASSVLNGFLPVLVDPFRKITYTSVSPGKRFRVVIVYEKIGDNNYSVLLQDKSNISTRLIYRSPDLDYPLRTERVVWQQGDTQFKLITKNSGDDSIKQDSSDRTLWCYVTGLRKLQNSCD